MTSLGQRTTPKSWSKAAKTLFFLGILTLPLFFSSAENDGEVSKASLENIEEAEVLLDNLGAFPIIIPTIKYGFAVDTFQVTEGVIKPNQYLAEILLPHKMDYVAIDQLVKNAKGTFDTRLLRAGKPYTILSSDTSQTADYFIYEPNVYEYIVFQLRDSLQVERVQRPVEVKMTTASGSIESSLWQTMMDNNLSYELAAKLEDALQWSVDFHHVQPGDEFKAVFEEKYIDGERVGVGQVKLGYYKNGAGEFFAAYFDDEEHGGYYDLEGRPMNKGFLRAPVKYSRISSRYNPRRFHPILKRVRPHYGTDYAAPYGTPILAVGNGVVTKASRTKGNGNYVKIKHDDTYETQYLHMQKFAAGISSGVQVKQGQVIGYVGSTGLATGPHVCFRFWKNGKQVNHLNLNFPPPKPLPESVLPQFYQDRDKWVAMLKDLEITPPSKALSEVDSTAVTLLSE